MTHARAFVHKHASTSRPARPRAPSRPRRRPRRRRRRRFPRRRTSPETRARPGVRPGPPLSAKRIAQIDRRRAGGDTPSCPFSANTHDRATTGRSPCTAGLPLAPGERSRPARSRRSRTRAPAFRRTRNRGTWAGPRRRRRRRRAGTLHAAPLDQRVGVSRAFALAALLATPREPGEVEVGVGDPARAAEAEIGELLRASTTASRSAPSPVMSTRFVTVTLSPQPLCTPRRSTTRSPSSARRARRAAGARVRARREPRRRISRRFVVERLLVVVERRLAGASRHGHASSPALRT